MPLTSQNSHLILAEPHGVCFHQLRKAETAKTMLCLGSMKDTQSWAQKWNCAFSAPDVASLMAIMADVNWKPDSSRMSHGFGDHGVLGLRTECCHPGESSGQGLFAPCWLTNNYKLSSYFVWDEGGIRHPRSYCSSTGKQWLVHDLDSPV